MSQDAILFDALLNDPKFQIIFLLLAAWSLVWKGFALWKAAKNAHRNWFIVMLVLNTFGILEIVYIFYFAAKPKSKEISSDQPKM